MLLLKADSWYVGHLTCSKSISGTYLCTSQYGHSGTLVVNFCVKHLPNLSTAYMVRSMAYAKIIQPCPQAFPGLKQVGLGTRLNLVILNLTFTHWFTSRPFSISLALSDSITN